MTRVMFDERQYLAPIPFDQRVLDAALRMKRLGLAWRPHIGCFVWDHDQRIVAPSPFPLNVYFMLSLRHFLTLLGSLDKIREALVWVPTWHQAHLVWLQLGDSPKTLLTSFQQNHCASAADALLFLYHRISDALPSCGEGVKEGANQ